MREPGIGAQNDPLYFEQVERYVSIASLSHNRNGGASWTARPPGETHLTMKLVGSELWRVTSATDIIRNGESITVKETRERVRCSICDELAEWTLDRLPYCSAHLLMQWREILPTYSEYLGGARAGAQA